MKKEYTRNTFATALIDLVSTGKDFKKITVGDIVNATPLTRQTFYNHFTDKFELVEWIYTNDVNVILQNNQGKEWQEVLLALYTNFYNKRAFYKSVFSDTSQNSLYEYLYNYDIHFYCELIKAKNDTNIIDDDLLFSIQYHANACLQMTRAWIIDNPDTPPEIFTKRLINSMPNSLLKIFILKEAQFYIL